MKDEGFNDDAFSGIRANVASNYMQKPVFGLKPDFRRIAKIICADG